jgi:hypothetical protein
MRTFYSRTATPSFFSPGANATWPLAELIVDDSRGLVTLRMRARWIRPLIQTWEASLDAVEVEAYGSSFFTRGVLLRTPGKPPAIFWCISAANQARALAAFGVHP